MATTKRHLLLSTTVIPLALVAGAAVGVGAVSAVTTPAAAACGANPCAAANPCNPCAAANPCASASPRNPCAVANPCNPCAGANPCNPCAAGGGDASNCTVPRLQEAAAKTPCAANPCAAGNPCNPCAAANPCNPCAAANPCAGANPCAATNPCNPCAAANLCNPCAAKNPCNPCAATNPCNPCGAANPCSPCGAAAQPSGLKPAEAVKLYDCLLDEMKQAYAKSGNEIATSYASWRRYSTRPYVSSTHGQRYVQNYANDTARAYGTYESGGEMPAGSTLAKDSFKVSGKGVGQVGPLFLMEKMEAGWYPKSEDWRYTLILPNGKVVGTTKGKGSDNVAFCITCHVNTAQRDSMLFPVEAARVE